MKTFSPPNTTPQMRNNITLFSQYQNMITNIKNILVMPMDLNYHTFKLCNRHLYEYIDQTNHIPKQ